MSEKPGLISYLFSKKGKLQKERQDLLREIDDLNLEKEVIIKRQERDKLKKEIAAMVKVDPQRKENPPARKAGEGAKARGKGREESTNAEDEAQDATEIGV